MFKRQKISRGIKFFQGSIARKEKTFTDRERGEVTVKGLAITVGAIVVIGSVVMWLGSGGGMRMMIEQVWEGVWGWISQVFDIGF